MWPFTRQKKSETPAEPENPRVSARVARLEIELEELRTLVEATWARQRKVEGAVHGMRGAARRWPQEASGQESFEQFRERELAKRQGITPLVVHHQENIHDEHQED